MRDGFNIAGAGVPAVALITEAFWPQGDFVAESLGMPTLPRVKLPHPVAGTGRENMRQIADELAGEILSALEGHSD